MHTTVFQSDVRARAVPLTHAWEHTVGSGHAPLALRADWQRQLAMAHRELGFGHVRFHGLLSDDVGALVNVNNTLRYGFFNVERIFDALLDRGVRPFVELSFMPRAISSGNTSVFKYAGNVTPPRKPADWVTLIHKLVSHCTQRYGVRETRKWFFEVWNEPNLKAFWTGSQRGYFNFYQRTAFAIKRVDDGLQVGGPATAANAWLDPFLEFTKKNRVPLDFVSTHHYPTDAFGSPGDDIVGQLSKSRRSVLREQAQDAHRKARGLPLYYTEWNTSSSARDALHDESFAAAFITKTVMETNGLVKGYSYWTFTDVFEENDFPSKPFHGGFGLLNLHGIPKPSYRAFELMHGLGTELLPVDGIHPTVDVWVVRGQGSTTALLTNWALPRHPLKTERVSIRLTGAKRPRTVTLGRIDATHANAKHTWQTMGEPGSLSRAQVERLLDASKVSHAPHRFTWRDGAVELDLNLEPNSVTAVTVS